ncbi:DUF2141 domain-containing protein [Tropicibacter sp. Alg240-R139]|uniref:DUF2141 domain-containing protein n=1 Tax=Tropicibacter sp. Alg240-R139 TaxID=2305991 RepID=UPI0013DF4437|nr:DUF2141 domain-containing protein [Tropicibacter sp. Alg240-R139]
MPTNVQRITAAVATVALFVGGAWVASGFSIDLPDASVSATGATSDEGLSVNLHGARNDTGNLIVMVFDQAGPFTNMDYQNTVGYLEVPASTFSQRLDFPDLNNTYYAIVAIHDENGDYELNYDETHLPTEGYAISGSNDLYSDPVFEYSLVEPGKVDLAIYYWQ